MKSFNSKDIIWEDYNEVEAEKYILYYEQDTMLIRWRAYAPHYFVRKDAVGTKEKMQEELEKHFHLHKKKIQEIIVRDNIPLEVIRQEIEKIFILREKYKQVFFPEIDNLLRDLAGLREKLNVKS